MSIRDLLGQNTPLSILSPMDGITDEAFRIVQSQIAKPDINFTEFVNAEGLSRGGVKLYDQLLFSDTEYPIIGQLFGKDPEAFYKSSIVLCELGFDGVDVNMGCPAKTVTQNGSGAALIGKPDVASEIIKAVKSGVNDWYENKRNVTDLGLNQKTLDVIERNKKYSNIKERNIVKPTVSVKTRLGITESIIEKWADFILNHELDFFSIHGRTLRQAYAGTADWNEIKKVVDLNQTKAKIFGNGDVQSKAQVIEYCQKYGVNGVLIGRAVCGNPWVFSDHLPTVQEKFSAMVLHSQIFTKIYPHRQFDSMRKHFLFYSSGLHHAKIMRSKLVRINSVEELLSLEEEFCT